MLLFLSVLMLALASCETVVDLDLEQGKPTLAVEAIVTDVSKKNFVKLTMSTPYAGEIPEPVTDAKVTITDDVGNSVAFLHTAEGLYQPAHEFRGKVGRHYTLTIEALGNTYQAVSYLSPVPPITKLSYRYIDGKNDFLGREEGYYISTGFQDKAGVRNYYKVDVLVEGRLQQRSASDILVTEDKLYDGSYLNDVDLLFTFKKGDRVEINLLSLTQEAYYFYAALASLAQQGGVFGRNPANLPSNISNDAVGFFSASAVSSRTLVIE